MKARTCRADGVLRQPAEVLGDVRGVWRPRAHHGEHHRPQVSRRAVSLLRLCSALVATSYAMRRGLLKAVHG